MPHSRAADSIALWDMAGRGAATGEGRTDPNYGTFGPLVEAAMTISMLDKIIFKFECPSSKCGKVTEESIGELDGMERFACPACLTAVDLKTEPYRSIVNKLLDVASELDRQARERGEVVKRF
jgi:hypothetical protein